MTVAVRLGGLADTDAALAVYERSNLARRHGHWPSRTSRLKHVAANLRAPDSWFLVAEADRDVVGMALALPFRTEFGAGQIVPGTAFLDLIYVLPERWGEGIGGAILDAVIAEADRRGARRIHLWAHERDNERAHRLYRSRGFERTGTSRSNEEGAEVAEWARSE